MTRALLFVVLTALSVAILPRVLVQAAMTTAVCQKATPANGHVPDPDWAFAYASWSEPYATDALRYFYTFTNQTNNNVPVRWLDANIIRIKTIPGQPIESDKVDAGPVGLLSSTISVGVQGADERSYDLKNCKSDAQPPDKDAINRKYGTAFHFKGEIVPLEQNAAPITLDIDFRSEIIESSLRYSVLKRVTPALKIEWSVPTAKTNVVLSASATKEPAYFPAVRFAELSTLRLVETRASVTDFRNRQLLAVFQIRVPIPGSR